MSEVYDAKKDSQWDTPYVDIDKSAQRKLPDGTPLPYRYIHGGFLGTDVRFSFCYPPKEQYEGRFYQFLSPFPGPEEEIASMVLTGEDDKIAFSLTHGAYYVETNMGSAAAFTNNPDNTMTWRSSAAAAEFSREIAEQVYDYEHRPFGYVYGGSGGGYRTIACIENTNAFDGAVPYIIGSPYAIPNCHTTRVHVMRILRHKMADVVDALDAGGSGDPYATLNEEETAALKEAELFGMPLRSMFSFEKLGDGAVPVLLPGVKQLDPGYFEDFWTKPGYLGTEPNSSAVRDRIHMDTKVVQAYAPEKKANALAGGNTNGADTAFLKMLSDGGASTEPWVELEQVPQGEDLYLPGTQLIIKSGKAAGKALKVERIEDDRVYIGATFGLDNLLEVIDSLETDDEVCVDNSDYIAFQTYHRHQVPDASYHGWDQYRNPDGTPKYPQRPVLVGPLFTSHGPGCKQNGEIQGKVIVVASYMDESAYPWQPDWYRRKIASVHGGDDSLMRLWYVDHSLHDDRARTIDELHVCSYLGALRQALVDLAAWVEKGIEPLPSSNYSVNVGQMVFPETAKERGGLQPTVDLLANGQKCAKVKPGELVEFTAEAEVPDGAGKITGAWWSFYGQQGFPAPAMDITLKDGGRRAVIRTKHVFHAPGTQFVVLKVASQRNGSDDPFTQVRNLSRVRVIVK